MACTDPRAPSLLGRVTAAVAATAASAAGTVLAAAVLTVAVAATLLLRADVALAAPTGASPADLVPLVDCVLRDADGTPTAVFGYDNRTGAVAEIPVGPANRLTPPRYDGNQPTRFSPGVHHGVLALGVRGRGGAVWHLGSTSLAVHEGDAACPSARELPANENGLSLGLTVGLVTAAVVAVLLVPWWRRRAPHDDGRPVPDGAVES